MGNGIILCKNDSEPPTSQWRDAVYQLGVASYGWRMMMPQPHMRLSSVSDLLSTTSAAFRSLVAVFLSIQTVSRHLLVYGLRFWSGLLLFGEFGTQAEWSLLDFSSSRIHASCQRPCRRNAAGHYVTCRCRL